MKQIDHIIEFLKQKKPIPDNVKPVIAYLLEEMREIEKHDNETVIIEMSPKMAEKYFAWAYDKEGFYKKSILESDK